MARIQTALLALVVAGMGATACELYVNDDPGSNGADSTGVAADGGVSSDAEAVCVPFCNKLETCGLVSAGSTSACVAHCEAQYAANWQDTRSGCYCVVHTYCFSTAKDAVGYCTGAPVPPN